MNQKPNETYHQYRVRMETEKLQALNFYRDLCGTYNGNVHKTGQGVASVCHIADTMKIPIDRAYYLCGLMVKHKVTERQSGGYVI